MPYVLLSDTSARHPKFLAAGPAACWLYVCGLTYCQGLATDGFIPTAAVPLLGVSRGYTPLVERLVRERLWDVVEGGYQVHDYTHYNRTRAERIADEAAKLDQRQDAGRASGVARRQARDRRLAHEGRQALPLDLSAEGRAGEAADFLNESARNVNEPGTGSLNEAGTPPLNEAGTPPLNGEGTPPLNGEGTPPLNDLRSAPLPLPSAPPRHTRAQAPVCVLPPRLALAGSLPRDHLRHVWCSQRGKCVPDFLHGEFRGALGGDPAEAEARLEVFYRETEARWPPGPIGDEPLTLWRKEFAAAFPSVAPATHSHGITRATASVLAALSREESYD